MVQIAAALLSWPNGGPLKVKVLNGIGVHKYKLIFQIATNHK